jgi:hypothetical protein
VPETAGFYRGVWRRRHGVVPEELQKREAVARRRVDELQAELEGLSVQLERAREDLARLVVTRETVAEVLGRCRPSKSCRGSG